MLRQQGLIGIVPGVLEKQPAKMRVFIVHRTEATQRRQGQMRQNFLINEAFGLGGGNQAALGNHICASRADARQPINRRLVFVLQRFDVDRRHLLQMKPAPGLHGRVF